MAEGLIDPTSVAAPVVRLIVYSCELPPTFSDAYAVPFPAIRIPPLSPYLRQAARQASEFRWPEDSE